MCSKITKGKPLPNAVKQGNCRNEKESLDCFFAPCIYRCDGQRKMEGKRHNFAIDPSPVSADVCGAPLTFLCLIFFFFFFFFCFSL
jgi:hypothetical protein